MSKLILLNFLVIFYMILYGSLSVAALSDPTKPAYLQKSRIVHKPAIKKKLKPLILRSIILSNSSKLAVINDSIVTVGDRIDAALVIEINRDYVIVRRNRKRITLPFGKIVVRESVKKSSLK